MYFLSLALKNYLVCDTFHLICVLLSFLSGLYLALQCEVLEHILSHIPVFISNVFIYKGCVRLNLNFLNVFKYTLKIIYI